MNENTLDSEVSSPGIVNNTEEPLDFDIWSSGTEERVLSILERVEGDVSEQDEWTEDSCPTFESIVLGLVSDKETFSNPFELTNEVKRQMMLSGEQAAASAREWNLNRFDHVGGRNT